MPLVSMYKRYREENLVEEYSNGRGRKRPPLPTACGYELELPVAADTSAAQPPLHHHHPKQQSQHNHHLKMQSLCNHNHSCQTPMHARFDVILQPQRCRPLAAQRAGQSEESLWGYAWPTQPSAALAQSPTAATQASSSAPEAEVEAPCEEEAEAPCEASPTDWSQLRVYMDTVD